MVSDRWWSSSLPHVRFFRVKNVTGPFEVSYFLQIDDISYYMFLI